MGASNDDGDSFFESADYNLISRKRVARNYHFDVLAAPLGTRALFDYVELFRKVKGVPGPEKGLLRVK